VIGGNIATGEGALALVEAGADAVKVGIGPGSICTTRIVTGVGVPQVRADRRRGAGDRRQRRAAARRRRVRFSATSPRRSPPARTSVMMGSAFAGTEEAPGEVILYQGRTYKSYRGMGSIGAMQQGSADRYFQDGEASTAGSAKLVPEGVEGQVPYKGSVVGIIFQMGGGLRAAMHYCGCASIEEMHARAEFVEITSSGMRESHVHDVQITKEAPNYRAE
jgi:IMP dehydrogenase